MKWLVERFKTTLGECMKDVFVIANPGVNPYQDTSR
jgi:hypothetical protein